MGHTIEMKVWYGSKGRGKRELKVGGSKLNECRVVMTCEETDHQLTTKDMGQRKINEGLKKTIGTSH